MFIFIWVYLDDLFKVKLWIAVVITFPSVKWFRVMQGFSCNARISKITFLSQAFSSWFFFDLENDKIQHKLVVQKWTQKETSGITWKIFALVNTPLPITNICIKTYPFDTYPWSGFSGHIGKLKLIILCKMKLKRSSNSIISMLSITYQCYL